MRIAGGVLLAALLSGCSHLALHREADPALLAALHAAHQARVDGPADVRIARSAYLRVEEGSVWIPATQGRALLRALGRPGDEILGVVIAETHDAAWYAVIQSTDRVSGWHMAPSLRSLSRR